MKFSNKIILFSIFALVICSTLTIESRDFDKQDFNQNVVNDGKIKLSVAAPRTTINDTDIGNSDWETMKTTYPAWISGSGTKQQPYIINDVQIDGGATGDSLTILDSNKYFIIQDSTFFNAGAATRAGIRLVNVSNGEIFSNNISNNDDFGIYLVNDCSNISIHDNTINDNGQYGILSYTDCSYNNITSNTIERNGMDGLYIRENNNTRIINNILFNNTNNGLLLWDTHYNSIEFNIIKENSVGIYGFNIENNTITTNIIKNNTGKGILFNSLCDNNSINGNYIYFNDGNQVSIDNANCDDNKVRSNILVSTTGEFINNAGTTTIIDLNYQLLEMPPLEISHQQTHTNVSHTVDITITSFFDFNLNITAFSAIWNSTQVIPANITNLSDGVYRLSLSLLYNDSASLFITVESETHAQIIYSVELFNYTNIQDGGGNNGGGDTTDDGDDDDDDDTGDSDPDPLTNNLLTIVILGFIANGAILAIAISIFKKGGGS